MNPVDMGKYSSFIIPASDFSRDYEKYMLNITIDAQIAVYSGILKFNAGVPLSSVSSTMYLHCSENDFDTLSAISSQLQVFFKNILFLKRNSSDNVVCGIRVQCFREDAIEIFDSANKNKVLHPLISHFYSKAKAVDLDFFRNRKTIVAYKMNIHGNSLVTDYSDSFSDYLLNQLRISSDVIGFEMLGFSLDEISENCALNTLFAKFGSVYVVGIDVGDEFYSQCVIVSNY